jgi:hypothetical protein
MKKTIVAVAVLFVSLTTATFAQQDTTWGKWSWLTGDWVGEGSGTPGQGGGWFSLQPDLGGKILLRKNHAEYPATKDRPGVIHDDLLIVYPDSAGQPGKAIYFDNEGHVINYAITYPDRSIVLTSGKAQNMPAFRLSYVSLSSDTISVKFEMSQDGVAFRTYTEGKCWRKKDEPRGR